MRSSLVLSIVGLLTAAACGLGSVGEDRPPSEAEPAEPSASSEPSSGGEANDGGAVTDAGEGTGPDAALPDAGVSDAGLLDAAAEAAVPVLCPELGDGGVTLSGHCYFLSAVPTDHPTAVAACISAGAHLVTITTDAEQTLVASIGPGDRWIGLTSPGGTNDRSTYGWLTAEPVTVDYWGPGEPNNKSPCVVIGGANASWSDRKCSELHVAVCERE